AAAASGDPRSWVRPGERLTSCGRATFADLATRAGGAVPRAPGGTRPGNRTTACYVSPGGLEHRAVPPSPGRGL
ncbi:MBL fold metallo-hydrolase, partial [Streptomyces aurantiacus]